ncbi:SDR family NAD(P)-dependent oxidoreductase [Polynucleobacter kasalickyi]|uniref:3-oxoacyl-[acyl-carrier protein] reductase n=1 Tax=Polynucleobacter kasalickyi TaxID=1938817 RepID=A0A1W1Z5K6_9BURK|nr:SDR family oxidoreductase [Polynucleobacter kasalickyi]SMC43401.1 3-oxoacyl-[acyl-carrier protein] reductase [Polynucleobacter kasalickyi]
MTTQSLKGQVAIVTGSVKNIGRAIAIALAREGAWVVINARSQSEQMAELVNEINQFGDGAKAIGIAADISSVAGAKLLIDESVKAFGKIDILINNAALRRHTPFAELEWEDWREVMGTILDGAYLCSKAALPYLKESSMGSIVNFGGLSAHTGSKERAHVVTAKMGLIGLTRALAHDLSEFGITVNCIVPGLIDTVRGESAGSGTPEHHGKNKTLFGRRGTTEEVANLVEFLCGPKARYITGQTIHANGGAYLA